MSSASIPVDVLNPGQVFACLGFLEATDFLLGRATAAFSWGPHQPTQFEITSAGPKDPFESVLEYISGAEIDEWAPRGYPNVNKKQKKRADEPRDEEKDGEAPGGEASNIELRPIFPARLADPMALPIRLRNGKHSADLASWCDGSGRPNVKLYAGNRTASGIAKSMLSGTKDTGGLSQLLAKRKAETVSAPFEAMVPTRGRFNLDARGAWTALDAGYSPDKQNHRVNASPIVEILAAWGLENARPEMLASGKFRYAIWGDRLDPALARAAIAGCIPVLGHRRFQAELRKSGRNKTVTFATEEPLNDTD